MISFVIVRCKFITSAEGGKNERRALTVAWADSAKDIGRGRSAPKTWLARLAQRQVIFFFWPIRASSAH